MNNLSKLSRVSMPGDTTTTRGDYQGSLVAFEGPTEIISTQLRLLPTSPQILILPGVQHYIASGATDGAFDPTTYIRTIHDAVATRNETAAAFLKEGRLDSKRLVFLNGGTPSAQALCIRAIAEHETDGDLDQAESLFHDMVGNGVAGLATYGERQATSWFNYGSRRDEDDDTDPITRAMRAADALDRQTAGLQPSTDIDLATKPRPRSMSLPIYGFADHFGDSAPFYVFGASEEDVMEEEESVYAMDLRSPRLQISQFHDVDDGMDRLDRIADMPQTPRTLRTPRLSLPPPRSPSCIGETYKRFSVHSTGGQDDARSVMSTDNVVYGEAAVVRMGLPLKKTRVERARSLDRIYPGSARYRNLPLRIPSHPTLQLGAGEIPGNGRRFSCMDVAHEQVATPPMSPTTPISSRYSYVGLPKAIFVKPKKQNIPFPAKKELPHRASYVDRGTDAKEVPAKDEPFEPVLPFTEDLVLYFKDESPQKLLDSVIQSFKDGIYPVGLPSSAASESDHVEVPGTPQSRRSSASVGEQTRDVSHEEVGHGADHDYDPFAYSHGQWEPKEPIQVTPTLILPTPPTPAQTPPPPMHEAEEKFHDFHTTNCHTAVAIQNSLRSILNVYFPPEANGFHQFNFPHLPELDGLWKPIFREAEPGSPGKENRKVDQILAIGSQRAVKKDYLSAISGQLEKLGTKSSGISRSGRLDFRYLIANAMQAFTAQPLSRQQDNPFTNSYLLATLIIPYLETYLAAHSEVRFLLLEYPPDHLATVLALQKLVGLNLMKVAQIVDSNSNEALSFTHIRGGSISTRNNDNQLLSPGPTSPTPRSLPPSPAPTTESLSFTRANFLLTSSASDSEISTFISTISKILVEISPFYAPEERPKSKASPQRRATPSPLAGTFSPFPKITLGPHSPPFWPPASATRFPNRSPSPSAASTKPSSVAETIKTMKSIRSQVGNKTGLSRKDSTRAGDAESMLTLDMDDSDFEDLEERRLMPIFMERPPVRKGNSRKALKFLGLA